MVGANVMILELCGGYFLIRTTLSTTGQAVALARLFTYALAVDGLLSILDVIMERPVLHDLAQSLTGFDQPWQQDYRHGFMRALGMQEHPIAFGTISAFGAILGLVLLRGARRILTCAGCLTGLLTSDSSAPITGFIFACACLLYHRLFAGFAWRWRALIAFSAVTTFVFFLCHPTPIEFLIDHVTSNPADGYYRLLTWSIVGPLVLQNPLFGLGLESDFAQKYDVINTIDCFWLCSAANFGIPCAGLFAAILLTSCRRPIRTCTAITSDEASLGRALGIVVCLYLYIGMTVHFWGCVWIMMGVFAALREHLSDLGRSTSELQTVANQNRFGLAALRAEAVR